MNRSTNNIAWYAVEISEEPLPDQHPGILVWEPVRTIRQLRDGEFVEMSDPVTPGYAFVGSLHGFGWQHVESVIGRRLVRLGAEPRTISTEEVNRVAIVEAEEQWIGRDTLTVGKKVVVTAKGSPYSGLSGVFHGVVEVVGGFFARVAVDVGGVDEVIRIPLDHVGIAHEIRR